MKILADQSVKKLNTFGVEASCKYLANVSDIREFTELFQGDVYHSNDPFILGGGSNILFTDNYNGLVIRNIIRGIEVLEENEEFVSLKVGAGENWHEFVLYCISNGYGGLENLSLIPGNVGASPMQNIGAYGVEVKSCVVGVECVDLKDGNFRSFSNEQCNFGYRTSIFKTDLAGKLLIHHVIFRLRKKPEFNTSYGAIEEEMKKLGFSEVSLENISRAVISIRKRKLPDPAVIGNAGSFFKNPVVPGAKVDELLAKYPDMPVYPADGDLKKLAAGWLIEKAGWKGKRFGNCGVHQNQALVLINYGGATGKEIIQLAENISTDIGNKFGIVLEREVNIV